MTDFEVSSTEGIADWIETSVLVSLSGRFGIDKLNDLAAAELNLPEAKVSMALRLMVKRQALLGVAYPFQVNEFAVLRRSERLIDSYAALLLLTPGSVARQTVRQAETHEMAELFEELTERALANFWGAGGHALRFGHPSKHGRPMEFSQAVPWLATRMGLKVGSGYRPPSRKDGGVDVVAWRQFADGRAGFPIALAQCTIQTDIFSKTRDIEPRLWASWLAMDSDPLSILVIPGTIRTAGPEWGQLTTVVMVIERMRLMELLLRGDVKDEPSQWTADTLEELGAFMKAGEL